MPYDDQPDPGRAVPPQRTGRPAPAVVPRAQPAPPPVNASFGLFTQAEPSSSITARLSELEARLAEPPPAKKAAAPKAPSKRVPRKVAEPARAPAPQPEAVAPAEPRATLGRGLRAALLLALLLLAAAAGLAAAAVVEARPATWQATTLVTLPNGQANTAQARYAGRVNAPAFTALSTFQAGLQTGQVRRPVFAEAVGADQLRLVVRASSRAATQRLVTAAGSSLVDAVRADQLLDNPTAGPAQVLGSPSAAVRLQPHDRDAQVAALLSGGAVLLLGGVAFLLRRTSSRS